MLNPRRLPAPQARRLALDRRARLAWGKERRVCQAVRFEAGGGLTVANTARDECPADLALRGRGAPARRRLRRRVAEPGDVLVLAGDFNVIRERRRRCPSCAEWGFSKPIPWIDQVLVRGARARPAHRWPDERRRVDGRLLSDHAPVEVTIE